MILFLINVQAYGRTAPVVSSDDYVWFATKQGLHRYNKAQNEWDVFSSENGLAGNDVRDIGIEEGIIWIATEGGVSNSDLRFSDWRSYTITEGLPSNDVKCIAFSRDYIWIGTDKGAARFDKILEEWKRYTTADSLAGDAVNDIAVDGETVWFATSGGISRFDIDFDKLTVMNVELPSTNVTWALSAGEHVWFITDMGLIRYDKRLKSWKSYKTADGIVSYLINDIVIDGNNLWLATQNGISIYDPVSDLWSEGFIYHTMLPSKNITGLDMDGSIVWFSTDNGVSSYDRATGSWRHYTSSSGLLDNFGQGIAVSGLVFAVTQKGINLYDKKTQEWDTYEFPESLKLSKGRKEKGFRVDERGLGFDLSEETQMRLSGLSSIEFMGTMKPERNDEYEWDMRNDISLKGTMPNKRSIVGFYNDIKEDNVIYGVTYRGNDKDLLQEANAGEFEAKMRNSELIEDINLIGAGARLRKGLVDKARLNVEPRYGEQRGYFETDFFSYKTGTAIYQLSHTDIIPETEIVIADREILQRGVDYIMIYPSGWLMFPQEELIEEGGKIEVLYQYEPTEEENEDDRLAILTTGTDLGDDYYIGLDLLHGDKLDVLSLNGEGKSIGIGPVSMKVKPEVAYSRSHQDMSSQRGGVASRAEIITTAPRTQLKFDYEGYSENFQTLRKRETSSGELERHLGVFSQFDITQWMPVTLRWQRDRSSNNSAVTLEEDAKMNIVLSKSHYPTIAIAGERNSTGPVDCSFGNEETENSIRTDFQYDLPEILLSFIKFRKAEVNSYYRQSYRSLSEGGRSKNRTMYAKLNLYPVERFDLSTSYKLNSTTEKDTDSPIYQLREEFRRLQIRSNFASLRGLVSDFHMDDMYSRTRTTEGNLVADKDRYITAGINLIPGIWTQKLEMITVLSRYSLLQQTVPVEGRLSADSNSRSVRLQANLRPHSTLLCTGIYEGIKSWLSNVQSVRNIRKYRSEVEFKPGSKSRIMLEYSQEHEDENGLLQKRLYSPSLWWETILSANWTARLRSVYQRFRIVEKGKVSEDGSILTPSLSFRYTNRKLPHNSKLYVTQVFSVAVEKQAMRDLASETYSASLRIEWKITRNLSYGLRASFSYKDDHGQNGSDKTANIYVRMTARF